MLCGRYGSIKIFFNLSLYFLKIFLEALKQFYTNMLNMKRYKADPLLINLFKWNKQSYTYQSNDLSLFYVPLPINKRNISAQPS